MRRAKRHGIDRDDADDLVQDAMLVALKRQDWQGIIKVDCYLLQIMDNLVSNHKRKHTAVTGLDVQAILDQVAQNTTYDLVDQMAHDQDVKEQVDKICAAAEAAGLTHSEAYVFYAKLRGKEYSEIAAILGLARETTLTYYSNALCKIRARVKSEQTKFAHGENEDE